MKPYITVCLGLDIARGLARVADEDRDTSSRLSGLIIVAMDILAIIFVWYLP